MKNILVPVDLSSATTQVCEQARTLAQLTGGKLVLLHVVQPPPVTMNEYYAFDPGQISVAVAAGTKFATHKLDELTQRLKKRGQAVRSVQTTGLPGPAILEQAGALKAAYIVMGSHGHGAFYDLFLGSTTQGVLKKARCPVLVVPIAPQKSRRK